MKKVFADIYNAYKSHGRISFCDFEFVAKSLGKNPYFLSEELKSRILNIFAWIFCELDNLIDCSSDPDKWQTHISCFSKQFNVNKEESGKIIYNFLAAYNGINRTKFIAIEGLDGSGKTVQSALLKQYFINLGKRAVVIDFPQYHEFFGREIGRFLSGKDTNENAMTLDEKSMCLWYAVDRLKTLKQYQLGMYDYVIFNRYTLSSVVYQNARQSKDIDKTFSNWIFELEHTHLELPIPDIYIFLDANIKETQNNNHKKENRLYVEGLDVYEKSDLLLERCRQIYLSLLIEIPSIKIVECANITGLLSPEDINQRICKIIDAEIL